MDDPDVPPGEMSWLRFRSDPIDAVLASEATDADLAEVAALVHDLRSAYLPDDGLRRSPELAAFAGAEPLDDVDAGRASRPLVAARVAESSTRARIVAGVAAVVATTSGKLVLGSAVAAASLGGMHAAEVVDVPLLPDRQPTTLEVPADPSTEAPFEVTERQPGTPPGVTDGSSASDGIARRPVDAPSEGPADPNEVVGETPASSGPGDPADDAAVDETPARDDAPQPDGPADRAPSSTPAAPPAEPAASQADDDAGPNEAAPARPAPQPEPAPAPYAGVSGPR